MLFVLKMPSSLGHNHPCYITNVFGARSDAHAMMFSSLEEAINAMETTKRNVHFKAPELFSPGFKDRFLCLEIVLLDAENKNRSHSLNPA